MKTHSNIMMDLRLNSNKSTRRKISMLSLFLISGLASSIVNAATYQKTTPANDDGGGNAIYLDRHHVECGDDAINRLHLYRPSMSQIAYEYGCTPLSNANSTDKYTNGNDDGGGNVIFLDRHTVNCEDKALQYIHLQRPTSNTIQYHYQCSDKPLSNVKDYFTASNEDGSGNAVYLDRHDVACPSNEVLSYLRLERPTSNTMRYHYKCGSLASSSVVGFTGDFAPENWEKTGVANFNMSASALAATVNSGGGGVTAKITIPASGQINFDWEMIVYHAGQYGDVIRYAINGDIYTLSSAGSASGSQQNIAVKAGDEFELYTWGTTKSSSYSAVFDNFTFESGNKIAPQCVFWGDNQGRNDPGFSGQTFIYQNTSYGTNRFMFNGQNKGEVPIGVNSVTDIDGNVFTFGSLVSQPYWDVWYYEVCVNM